MKFTAVVGIVPEDMEQTFADKARELGAGGIAYDGNQSVLIMVLERKLSLEILKAFEAMLHDEDESNSKGLVFSFPLEHLRGMDMGQIQKFEQHLKDSL